MKFNGRVIAELVGGLIAIVTAFIAYFSGAPGFWIGVCVGVGVVLLGCAALTIQQLQEQER